MLERLDRTDYSDASKNNSATDVIDIIPFLLATSSCAEFGRLSELEDAKECECEKEQGCEDVMNVSDDVLSVGRSQWRFEFGSRGEPGDTERKEADKTPGYPVREIVPFRGQMKYADGAEQAHKDISHIGVVVRANGRFDCDRLVRESLKCKFTKCENDWKGETDPPDSLA